MRPETGECCKACGDTTEESTYVQCDKCDNWWHFSCAGLTEPREVVEKRPWLCVACADNVRPGRVKRTPVKSTGRKRDATKDNLTSAKVSSGEKSDLTVTERGSDGVPGKSNLILAEIDDGVAENSKTQSNGIRDNVPTKRRKRVQLELELKFVREEEELLSAEISETAPSVKFAVNSAEKEKEAESISNVQQSEKVPTRQQYKARNAATNELPAFSGDPAEWPMFITHYEQTTKRCGFSNWENMIRLQKAVEGSALEAVRSRLLLPDMVPAVIVTLRARYGRPALLIKALIEKVRRLPVPCKEKPDTVITFSKAVKGMVDHMRAAGQLAHLTNPVLLEEMVGKLPIDEQYSWVRYAGDIDEPDLTMFGQFMGELQRDAAKVTHISTSTPRAAERKKTGSRGYVNTHMSNQEPDAVNLGSNQEKCCLVCNKKGHEITKCYTFGAMAVKDRCQKARSLSLCFGCLGKHNRRACQNKPVCGIRGCTYRHHALLHDKAESCGVGGEGIPEGGAVVVSNHHQYVTSSSTALFRIVPFTLYGPGTNVSIFTFLDEGSSVTLLDEDLAVQLGVEGVVEPLCMRRTGDTTRIEKGSRRVNLKVGPIGSSKQFTINSVRTVSNLNLPSQTLRLDAGMGEHLRQLPIRQYREAVPKLLIGLDNLRLAVPLRTKEEKVGEAIAVKTRLGWCIYGKPFCGSEV